MTKDGGATPGEVRAIRRSRDAAHSTEDQILQAAYTCFDRHGFRRTTVEDIAAEARVSRATLYRYFSNKDEIVERLSVVETDKVTTEIRRQLTRGASTGETIAQCLFLATRIAHANPYVRAMVEETNSSARASDPNSRAHQAWRATWGHFIEDAMAAGAFAPDLKVDDVAGWLVLAQSFLLVKVDAAPISDPALKAFIVRFVVSPLLAGPTHQASSDLAD